MLNCCQLMIAELELCWITVPFGAGLPMVAWPRPTTTPPVGAGTKPDRAADRGGGENCGRAPPESAGG